MPIPPRSARAWPIRSRSVLGLSGNGLFGTLANNGAMRRWLGGAVGKPFRSAGPDDIAVPPITVTTDAGIRIHGIQTGLLAIKSAHLQLRGIKALRLLSIIQDGAWTPLLPILTWVIEHREGLIVIDTGERAAASDIDTYMASDPNNRWFFKRNLPMFVTPAEELATQMRCLGLVPEEVRIVVLTHLHGDHAGGLGFFPRAEFLVAREEFLGQLRQPMGAIRSLWPEGFAPRLVDHTGPRLGPFPASLALTKAADVLLVPTPGHSYGHQSVVLKDGEVSYFFAGDLAFSQEQLLGQGLQGIAQNLDQSQQTLARALAYTQQAPTIFLPSHDPQSLGRLRDRATLSG